MAKVLIIEDDAELCETYSDILRGAGHEVNYLVSGGDALRTITRSLPDVVILDMHLPGLQGDAVLHYIRTHQRLAKTRVVIISGHPEKAQTAASLWGADTWIAKPVSIDVLRDTVAKLSKISASS